MNVTRLIYQPVNVGQLGFQGQPWQEAATRCSSETTAWPELT